MKEWYVFIKVVERGSITPAAKDMNIVPSAVSKIRGLRASDVKNHVNEIIHCLC